ncbi:hypothetical protein [Microvirga sesbaniae]|uniref:hypothetical protein n=1 Tax=Microvirga sesbaniae TaxID=681392 RepID=UPI0021C6D867|nr:hypothetical protein [Microvirga sp. HBU67692]
MEWTWVWVVGLALGGYAAWRWSTNVRALRRDAQTAQDWRVERASAQDRALALAALRRELANVLIREDPDRFLRVAERARQTDLDIQKADNANRQARRKVLTDRIPYYTDFDIVGTHDHVLYADALSWRSFEDIEQHYLAIVEFHALQHAMEEHWKDLPATSERALEHLREYVRKIKDTRFKRRIIEAEKEYFAYRQGLDEGSGTTILTRGRERYETRQLAVLPVPHVAESRLGIHFKDTDEYGIFSVFYGDDKTFYSQYRSNATFEKETYLDTLGSVEI